MKKNIKYIIIIVFIIILTYSFQISKNVYKSYAIEGRKYLANNDILKIYDDYIKVENNNISNISAGTTVENLKSWIETNNITITTNDGNEKNNNEILKTGDKLLFNDKIYNLSISGDVTGDGKINEEDASSIAKHIIDNDMNNDSSLLASDINNDNSIKINDIIKVLKQQKGINKIHFLATSTSDTNSDSILLESNGHYGLIDTATSAQATSIVVPYLKNILKEKKLDFIIITHRHADHNGGISKLCNNTEGYCFFDSNTTYYYRQWEDYSSLDKNGLSRHYYALTFKKIAESGAHAIEIDFNGNFHDVTSKLNDLNFTVQQENSNRIEITDNNGNLVKELGNNDNRLDYNTVNLGEFNIEFLNYEQNNGENLILKNDQYSNLPKTILSNDDTNRFSLIELIKYNNYKVLLTGDMEIDDEYRFLVSTTNNKKLPNWYSNETSIETPHIELNETNRKNIGRIDILKMGHHGFYTSNSNEFMEYLKPKDAVNLSYNASSHFGVQAMSAYRYLQKYYNSNLYSTAFAYANSKYNDENSIYALVTTFNENGYDFSINAINSEIETDIDDAKLYVYSKENMEKTVVNDENGQEIGHFENLGLIKDDNGQIKYATYYFSKDIKGWYSFGLNYPVYVNEDIALKYWQLIGDDMYYFVTSGAMRRNNTYTIGNISYTFDANGKVTKIGGNELSNSSKIKIGTNKAYCYNNTKWISCE